MGELIEASDSLPVPPADAAPIDIQISQAILTGTDPSALKTLLEVKQSFEADEARKAFALAMSEAHADMPSVGRSAENAQTKSTYARLEDVLRAAKPIYTALGFWLDSA